MDDGLVGFLAGVAGAAGFLSVLFGSIIARSRYTVPRKLVKAEDDVRSGTNLQETYSDLSMLGASSVFVPREVRDRARYLKGEIETNYLERIRSEVRENMPRDDHEIIVYLGSGQWIQDFTPEKPSLEDLSPTYREHFFAPAEEL